MSSFLGEPAVEKAAAEAMNFDHGGCSAPLGATLVPRGANFSVYSRNASAVELLLFDRENDSRPARVIPIDLFCNRTYHYWHVFVPGVKAGQLYAYRVHGPFDPVNGMRFDPSKVLLDPYGRAVAVPSGYSRSAARAEGDNAATAMKSVVVDPTDYDWEGDMRLRHVRLADDYLRDACARLHAPSQFRRAGGNTRHLCRFDRKDPLS